MEIGAPMHAGIWIARVIQIGASTITGPIAIEEGDLDRVKARRGKIYIRIKCYIAVATVIVDDIDPANCDPGTVIRCGADAQIARVRDVDETSKTKGSVVKIRG